jgi:hypothetical protein
MMKNSCLKIGIFGYHPDIKPGFNSAMSLSWIVGLTKLQHEIIFIVLGTTSDVSLLPSYGARQMLLPLDALTQLKNKELDLDLIIWQSYWQSDKENFFPSDLGVPVAKSFPRLFTSNFELDLTRIEGALNQFDMVMLSLHEDYERSLIWSDNSRISYVPRGFPLEMLRPQKSSRFTVALDIRKRSNINQNDYKFFYTIKDILENEGFNFNFLVLGKKLDGFEHIKRQASSDFYKKFLNISHVYLFVDRNEEFIDAHNLPGGGKSFCGVYENTVIEAQLAGAMVIGPDDLIANELMLNGYGGVRLTNDRDPHVVADALKYCFRVFPSVSIPNRLKTQKNHSSVSMARGLISAFTKFKNDNKIVN